MNMVVSSRNVTVKKGRVLALDDVSFALEQGTITGLLGPSGAGKTTLMRAIIGVQKLTSGSLSIFGQPAGSKNLRPRIGYVTQDPAVYFDLTVRENLKYFATLANAPASQIKEVTKQVRLDSQEKQLVGTLSGGEKTRVSLAVALLGKPDLLVFDEPTVGLDPLLRKELWELFGELAKSGKTLVISSHVMDEAEHCDSLLLVRNGKLVWHDDKEKLLKHTKQQSVEAAFLKIVEGK